MLPSACSFIVDVSLSYVWLSLFYTTCFGLHGHLQVCICFTFIFLKESASLFLLHFLARGCTLHVSICVFLLFFFVNFLILVCLFAFSCCLNYNNYGNATCPSANPDPERGSWPNNNYAAHYMNTTEGLESG
jgi:hypothetical protein